MLRVGEHDDEDAKTKVKLDMNAPITKAGMKQEMIHALRSLLVLTGTLKPIREPITVNIRLLYNETCPSEYEPRRFMKDVSDAPEIHSNFKMQIGQVVTPSHR